MCGLVSVHGGWVVGQDMGPGLSRAWLRSGAQISLPCYLPTLNHVLRIHFSEGTNLVHPEGNRTPN